MQGDTSPIRFDDEVAIVTGAGKGIGRAHAECLAARGARVVVNNRQHGEADPAQRSADRVVADIRARGGEAIADHEDAAEPGSGERLVAHALEAFGRLDVVICNAGVAHVGMFHKLSAAALREMVAANLLGTLELVHAALPPMREAGYGRVVVTSSTSALGDVGYAAYAATKTAMHGFVRSLALESRGKGIHVNALMPFAHTQMTDRHFESGAFPKPAAAHVTPAQVAELAAWLASRECTLSGELIALVGGTCRRVELLQSRGLELDPREVSAERLRAGFERVTDMADPLAYATGGDLLVELVGRSLQRATGQDDAD